MKTYFQINNTTFLEKAKSEYSLAVKNPKQFENYVNDLSNTLGLKGKSKFNAKRIPKFWAGRLNSKPKIIMFGLNPGQGKDPKKWPNEKKLRKSWEYYKKTRDQTLSELSNRKSSPYYQVFYKLCSGLYELNNEKKIDWKFFDKNVLNLNLFPYHSNKSTDFPGRFIAGQLAMVMQHLDLILEFALSQKPKLCVFNGKTWKVLLIDHKLVKNPKEVRIIGNFSLYFFKYKKLNCILFNHFLQSTGHDGMTDKILMKKIPKIIKKEYSV